MHKPKYSNNPIDWHLNCTTCGTKKIYSSKPTYANALRAVNNGKQLRCRKCMNKGKIVSDLTKKNMSTAALSRSINPENETIRRQKISNYHKSRYELLTDQERLELNTKIVNGQINKPVHEITSWRQKKSEARKAEMKRNGVCDTFAPSYNKDTIPYINEVLNKKYNTKFLHAETINGEYKIYDKLNRKFYYADAYCPVLNIWVEFDEPSHYINNKLKKSDVYREDRIKEILKCIFLRIKTSELKKEKSHGLSE